MSLTLEEKEKRRLAQARERQKRYYERHRGEPGAARPLTVHMPNDLAERLDRLHREYGAGISRSVFICRALEQHFDYLAGAQAEVDLGGWGAPDGLG